MSGGLLLVALVVLGYVAAHAGFRWLERRYFVVGGGEYLVLGVLLGPYAGRVLGERDVLDFAPFIVLGLGWVGVAIGMRLQLRRLVRVSAQALGIAVLQWAIAASAIFTAMLLGLRAGLHLPPERALPVALVAAVLGSTTSVRGVEVVRRRHGGNPTLRQVETTAVTSALLGLLAFTVVLAAWHAPVHVVPRAPTPTEWVAIALAIGLVGGFLFYLFLGGESDPDRLVIALLGAIILIAGAAAYIGLSPMFTGVLLGAMLANTAPQRSRLRRLVLGLGAPLELAVLVLIGALWRPSEYPWFFPLATFVLLQPIAKLGAAALATQVGGRPAGVHAEWGAALTAPGWLPLALALNWRLLPGAPAANLLLTMAIVSTILYDALAPRFVRRASGLDRVVEGDA